MPEEWRRSVPVPKEYYRCRICFEDVDTEVQRRSEEAAQRKHITGEELWNCMRKSGAAEKYVRVCMYESCKTVVMCVADVTVTKLKVEVGLH